MVLAMRALRFAFDSRRVLCADWACAAPAPLAMRAASNTAATFFTLNLKPNINEYSCSQACFCYCRTRGPRYESQPQAISLLEHPPRLSGAERRQYLRRRALRWRKSPAAAVLERFFSGFSLVSQPWR